MALQRAAAILLQQACEPSMRALCAAAPCRSNATATSAANHLPGCQSFGLTCACSSGGVCAASCIDSAVTGRMTPAAGAPLLAATQNLQALGTHASTLPGTALQQASSLGVAWRPPLLPGGALPSTSSTSTSRSVLLHSSSQRPRRLAIRASLGHLPFPGIRASAESTEQPPGHSQGQSRALFNMLGGKVPESKLWQQRRLVGWSPEQFYMVVSDVEQYHHFVPWCQKSQVLRRTGENSLEAELEVGFQVLVERYTSKVIFERPRLVRSEVSDSSLFHHLNSSWILDPGPTHRTCWLNFKVDFAFNSVMYGNLADLFFSQVAKEMVGAFEGRCAKLYGPSSLLNLSKARSTS